MEVERITNEQIAKAREFDNHTINFIFDQFKPFIRSLAFKYFLVGADEDDVMQEAMIGLFLAIKNFNSEKNVSFESFARHCIVLSLKTAVKNSLRQKHIPLNNSLSIDTEFDDLVNIQAKGPEDLSISNENFEIINIKLRKILSKFELSVLYLLYSGMTYKEVATVLGRSVKSVDNALQRIKKKAAPLFDFELT